MLGEVGEERRWRELPLTWEWTAQERPVGLGISSALQGWRGASQREEASQLAEGQGEPGSGRGDRNGSEGEAQ